MDFNKGHLLSFYEAIEDKRKERDKHIEEVNKIDKEIQIELLEYRINSVKRVLDYLKGIDKDTDTMIIHCINKLDGNVDGVELDLKEK